MACHTPVSGWSPATITNDWVRVVAERPDGSFFVMGWDAQHEVFAEFFAVQ